MTEPDSVGSSLISLSGTVRGQSGPIKVRALIDSGAEANFVSRAILDQTGQTPDDLKGATFRSLNGQSLAIQGRTRLLYSVTDSIGQERGGPDDFFVGNIEGFDIVLGMPWLANWNPVPNFAQKTIRFRNNRKNRGRRFRKLGMEWGDEFSVTARDPENCCYLMSVCRVDVNVPTEPILPAVYPKEYEKAFSAESAAILAEHGPHEMSIDLMPGKEPPHGPLYSLSQTEAKLLREYIEKNLERGWIRHSTSKAGAPVLFAKKKDGSLRLCVDYRGLNAVTEKNRYALPLIQESLDRLGEAKIYTKLDLRDAYHRIRIKKGDEWKTAFRTRYGHFEYTVMPFGLTNAPAVFQSHINKILSDLLDICVIVYLDDILIYSKTEEEHVEQVKTVLDRLMKHRLYAKMSKCEFHTDMVAYLGFVVTPEGITMEEDRVASIKDWPIPKTVREVRIFLGFANYYRRFIEGFSRIASPLHHLTIRPAGAVCGGYKQRKEESVLLEIGEEARAAFQLLKDKFSSGPLLVHFDPRLPCRIETDASGFAISGILSQPRPGKNGKVQWHPVAFYSRKMSSAERNYDTHDGELLAIVEAFKHWRHYVEGPVVKAVELLTDHANLQGFMTTKALSRRQARWAEWLAAFDFKITHRPGKSNPADGPSRRPDYEAEGMAQDAMDLGADGRILRELQTKLGLNSETPDATAVKNDRKALESLNRPWVVATTRVTTPGRPLLAGCATQLEGTDVPLANAIIKQMSGDKHAERVFEELSKNETERPDWVRCWSTSENGALLYKGKIFAPEGTRLQILQTCHDDPLAGHFGFKRTLQGIQREFYWPGMRKYVKDYVRTCQACLRAKSTRHARYGTLQALPIPDKIWEDISMDMITDLPPSKLMGRTHDSILVIIDRLSKMAHYIPISKKLTAAGLAEVFLREVIRLHGPPKSIVSDRGPIFTSAYWSTFAQWLGTKRLLSTAFHPQTDGQTERQNQTLEQYLRVYCSYEQDNWAKLLSEAEFAYNNSVHDSTGISPFYAVYGQEMSISGLPADFKKAGAAPQATRDVSSLLKARDDMKDRLQKAQEYQAKYHNLKRKPMSFKVDDLVYLDARNLTSSRPKKKLDDKYWGPFKIKNIIGDQAYELGLPKDYHIHPVFHVSLLEPAPLESLLPRSQPQPKAIVPQTGQADVYDVERIVGQTMDNDRWLYEIKWVGYPEEENTWLPAEDISRAAMAKYKKRIAQEKALTVPQAKRNRGRPPKRRGAT